MPGSNAPGTDQVANPVFVDGTVPTAFTMSAGGIGTWGILGTIAAALLAGVLKTQLVDSAGTNRATISSLGSVKSSNCFPKYSIPKSSGSAGYVLLSGANKFAKIWNASASDLTTQTLSLYDSASTSPTGDPFMIITNFGAGQVIEFNCNLTNGLAIVLSGGTLPNDAGVWTTNEAA
jgi:hypothetical protein